MSIKIAHASIDERGKATGGAAGDQTGREVCIRDWYTASWDVVLRPKTSTIAEKSAKFMEQVCANNAVGYDQWQRNSLFEQAKKVNFDASKITVKCECDCSSLIHVAVIAAGVNVPYGSNGFTTSTMTNKLVASGNYEKLTDSKYLTSDKYLKRGDILVNVGSHTVMVLENGSGVSNVVSSTSTSAISVGTVVSIAKNATYYNSTKAPGSWILNKTWIVKSVSGNRVVIDKSSDGQSSINSPIDAKYLTVVNNKTTTASTTTTTTTTTPTASATPTATTKPTATTTVSSTVTNKVDIIYAVKVDGKWLPEVKNNTDYAGIENKSITDVMIKLSNGTPLKYRVHIKGGNWLSYVTGYNKNDHNNGYAGNGKAIDAIEIKCDKYEIGYKVSSTVNGASYYSEVKDSQNDYAGVFGKPIDKLMCRVL